MRFPLSGWAEWSGYFCVYVVYLIGFSLFCKNKIIHTKYLIKSFSLLTYFFLFFSFFSCFFKRVVFFLHLHIFLFCTFDTFHIFYFIFIYCKSLPLRYSNMEHLSMKHERDVMSWWSRGSHTLLMSKLLYS